MEYIPSVILEVSPTSLQQTVTGFLPQMSFLEQVLFCLCIVVLLAGAWSLLNLSFRLMKIQQIRLLKEFSPEQLSAIEPEMLAPTTSWWKQLYDKLVDNVPIEKEESFLLDHDYDGVRELDNNLPPWWKGVFYLSIAFAPFYIWYSHYSDYAQSSGMAYVQEMETAEREVKAYLDTQENAVDESNVVALLDEAAISNGSAIFKAKCSVCHGNKGEGGIGPNLTDEYWLHGGSIADIFKVIKHGVPEKGMIAWKNELRPRDIQEVASFIQSIGGTEPENAKEAQGEKFTPSLSK